MSSGDLGKRAVTGSSLVGTVASQGSTGSVALDSYDRKILAALQTSGRMSNQELADAIGLSPSPCLRRVRQLEETGLIEGYRAQVNARKLGLALMAFIQIGMDRHTPERFQSFEQTVADFPEVLECHLIAGQSADYLLKVIVKDMDDYQQFLLQKLTRIDGVSGVHSSFVLKSPLQRTAYPV
ncbi:MAG TPA: Lrp/AsnC family transcriptional regulator [Marinagarivorans sp.]